MAWDDPPILRPSSGSSSPDFDQFLRDAKKLWRDHKFKLLGGVGLGLLALTLFTSYYTVSVNEEAVSLRFGKYLETTGSGLHFKLPFGIDRVIKEEVNTIHKAEFGFRTVQSDRVSSFDYSQREAQDVALMLSADLNCAEVNWVVRYKIRDLKAHLFNVKTVKEAIRDASEAVMRKIVGNSSIDEVLMSRPAEMEDIARAKLQERLDLYGCGIDVRGVKFKRIDPPTPVKGAFDEVNQSRQMRDQIINEAEAQRNRELIPAEGQKTRMIEIANGYLEKRVNEAEGDSHAFLTVLAEYQKAKEITRRRLYLETMAKILPRCGKITLIDESQKGILPLLQLNGEKGGER